MIKKGKTIIIGLSSIVAVGMGTKMVSFADEKLTTDSRQDTSNDNNAAEKTSNPIVGVAKAESKIYKITNSTLKILSPEKRALVDKIIMTGLNRIGTPYLSGGSSEKGFDCSGFVHYAFGRFNIQVPHSSKLIAETGKHVKLEETRKGDILVFTGTNVSDRTPGHVGIVISKVGKSIEFIHSSSNGGVKISHVDGTNYERRFLETRRVL